MDQVSDFSDYFEHTRKMVIPQVSYPTYSKVLSMNLSDF